MIVDDRLDTVLRTPAAGVAASRIRYRQLVDLLGRLPDPQWTDAHRAALVRLDQFGEDLSETDRARVIETAVIRSAQLVRHLAGSDARVAAAALAVARLDEQVWLDIIPDLPIRARGFLRHRRNLGEKVEQLLERFGIGDFALPVPDGYEVPLAKQAEPVVADEPVVAEKPTEKPVQTSVRPAPAAPAQEPVGSGTSGIGAIVRRIEAFRQARNAAQNGGPADPRLPFADETDAHRIREIQFRTDAEGAIVWADGPAQALLWGHTPFTAEAEAPARCDLGTLRAVRGRTPVREGRLDLEGVEAIQGAWRIDAIPLFADRGGRFTGYLGRLRRPRQDVAPAGAPGTDRLRQLLHELRTPVNAIQGFAELIQQQIFGPTPHEYRSLAASIAADAARILGGFDDIDRLVKLESGHVAAEQGEADLGVVFDRLMGQLEPVVAPREVRMKVERPVGALPTAIDEMELERMIWRVLAIIGSATQPGERLRFVVLQDQGGYTLSLPLPATLAAREDDELFAPDSSGAAAFPSTAMLGSGFALRLAAAEARAAGGMLNRDGARVLIHLPAADQQAHSAGKAQRSEP